MKKLIVAFICISMLWGCTPKTEPVPVTDPEPEKTQSLPLPIEMLYGYWIADDNSYIGFLPDGENTSIDLGILDNIESDFGKMSEYTGDEGTYEIRISYDDGKIRLLELNCLLDTENKIAIGQKEYSYFCGFDGSFEWLRYDYLMRDVDSFYDLTNGYWNSDDGKFIRIWEEDGERWFMNGLYDAGGPASGTLTAIATDKATGTTKFLTIRVPALGFPPFPEKEEYRTITLDMEAIAEKIIILNEDPYTYVGSEWDEAYNDFVTRVRNY